MELLKKKRATARTSVTKVLNSLNVLLDEPTAGTAELKVAYDLLVNKHQELEVAAANFIDGLQSEDVDEQEIDKEVDENDAYTSKFLMAKYKFENRMASRNNSRAASVSSVPIVNVGCAAQNELKKSIKLPKIDPVMFSGNVREWLQFWSLFKKIHENRDLDKEEKFQYLLQAMVPGSRAEELARSYPPTAENYDKVISSLKKRFGREDLIIEVYVRELLQLVLQNAVSNKEIQLSTVYDKIESYLRALETLGVTTDKCAAMLIPLVESSLPEDLLRVWQRSSGASEIDAAVNSSEASKNRLVKLMNFLESEVQNEMRIAMAVKGFGISSSGTSESARLRKQKSQEVPSARCLITANKRENVCIFCEREDHDSANCSKAENMSYNEK